MKLRLFATALMACFGAGMAHADDPVVPGDDAAIETAPAHLPKIELTPQLLHEFLLAEIAGQRGQVALAVGTYLDLAKATHDPRVAKRAAEVALFSRQYDAALEAARIWADADPDSQQARQMLASLLAASGRSEELSVHIAKMLSSAGPNIGPALLRLNRVFARSTDKAAVHRLIDEVTAPYLGIAEAHFARAIAAYEAQDQIAARHEIDRALSLRPDWEQAALVRAQIAPHDPEMLDDLKRFVAANPQAHDARLAYARALVGAKRYEEARSEFTQLLADNPDNGDVIYAVAVLSLQLNDHTLAERYLKRLVELGYSDADSARLYLGQIAEERKSWGEAIQWYAQVTAGEQYLAAQLRLANVLAQTGRLDEARKGLHEVQASSPQERTQLILGEAQLLREAGRHVDAYAVLDAGLAAQPDQPDILYEAALAAEKIGQPDVLERDLRRLIKLQPDHAHAYNALGYSLADRGERLDEAKQLIDKALELAPEDPFILDSKGWLLYRKGDAGGALDVLKRALTLRPDPEIAAHVGEVLWVLGRHDEALKAWNDAAQASPGNEALSATIKRFQP
ncbi:MAG: tetratricopeptide repeat protein [Rhodocyclaceae bacterium]|nr:tetratricopeptide repeat protein [Rhodocyclaceae bacterium]